MDAPKPPIALAAALAPDAERLERLLGARRRGVHGHAVLLEPPVGADVPAAAGRLGPRRCLRLLDHLWLVLPFDEAAAQRLLADVYDALAPGYAERVDRARTQRTIGVLLDAVAARLPDGPRLVIDLGCGVGLAAEPARRRALELLGVDVSPAMRAEAERRGERAVAPPGLAALAPGSARGAIASYLLHLVPRPAGLEAAWRAIAPGGALAANVHKGRRLDEAAAVLATLGARVERPDPPAGAPEHGPLLIAVKPA